MKEFLGAIRLVHCITAKTPEEFYKYYPGSKTKQSSTALDYWNRMLGEDRTRVNEQRRRQRERAKARREKMKNERTD